MFYFKEIIQFNKENIEQWNNVYGVHPLLYNSQRLGINLGNSCDIFLHFLLQIIFVIVSIY